MSNSDAPAYPDNWDAKLPGLTKREYFAAMAMQGFIASDVDGAMSHDNCATISVMQADALLKELEK